MAFLPRPDQTIDFNGRSFRFVQHRAAKDPMVHAETGARATVFLAMQGAESWALKVFRPKFRKQHQAEVVSRLIGLRGMPGLRVAEREVVLPDNPLVASHKDLAYAQLMPWVSGVPWANILTFGVQKNQCYLDPAHAFELCHRFLSTMLQLERRTIAHTDIASGNVLVDPDALSVELIDLEEMYGPGFPEPGQRNIGSAGYTHPSVRASGEGLWFPEADRFAATILAAEMLVLAHPQLAQSADHGGGYFDNDEFGQRTARFAAAYDYLSYVLPDFAQVFMRAWTSPSLRDCPRAEELLSAFSMAGASVPRPSGPALVPVHQSPSWTPPVTSRRSTSQPSPSNPTAASASSPPASSSTPPTSDPEVIVGWSRLGAPAARPDASLGEGLRHPVQIGFQSASNSTPPQAVTHQVSPAPQQPAATPLFAHPNLYVQSDLVRCGMRLLSPQRIRRVWVERRVGAKDFVMAVLLSTSGSIAVVAAYTFHLALAYASGFTALGALFVYLGIGVGKPVLLLLHDGSSVPSEVPLETPQMAESAASAVRSVSGL